MCRCADEARVVPISPSWNPCGRTANGGLTIFDQEYRVRRGRQVTAHPFTLTFRTLPVKGMTRRLERAGFAIKAVLGDYRGRPWDARADVWIILAEKV